MSCCSLGLCFTQSRRLAYACLYHDLSFIFAPLGILYRQHCFHTGFSCHELSVNVRNDEGSVVSREQSIEQTPCCINPTPR